MLNVNQEDALRATEDFDYATKLATELQPVVIAALFQWLDDKEIGHGTGQCDGVICRDCGQFTMYSERCRYIFAEEDDYICVSIPCIRTAVVTIGHNYKISQYTG